MATWQNPPLSLFPGRSGSGTLYTEHSGGDISDFLTKSGIHCYCMANKAGAQVDTYYFSILDYSKYSRLPRLLPALSAWAGVTVRQAQQAPAGAFALELQRRNRQNVGFGSCVSSSSWQGSSMGAALVGAGNGGTVTALNIDHAPHVLIAGQTGSGKSVLCNTIIASLLLKNSPDDAEFIFIDPKQVEFSRYASLPHVKSNGMVTSVDGALQALQRLCNRMDTRYKNMQKSGHKEFSGKKIYIFIDELADLMLTAGKLKKQVEGCIIRIAQKGRAAGLHLIIATQTPRASVITGLISANIPVKIALTVSSTRESVLILGHKGAEQLTGSGDCILKTPLAGEMRLQAAYISDAEIDALVAFWQRQRPFDTGIGLPRFIKKLLSL